MKVVTNYHIKHDGKMIEPETEMEVKDEVGQYWVDSGSARRPVAPVEEPEGGKKKGK